MNKVKKILIETAEDRLGFSKECPCVAQEEFDYVQGMYGMALLLNEIDSEEILDWWENICHEFNTVIAQYDLEKSWGVK